MSAVSNNTPNIISKRSRIDELTVKEEKLEEINKSDFSSDKNAPTLKLCLRLPNGCKETISMVASQKVEVSNILLLNFLL